jgi:hypothetical protein
MHQHHGVYVTCDRRIMTRISALVGGSVTPDGDAMFTYRVDAMEMTVSKASGK